MTRSALVTGAAGFIGSHLVDRLLGDGWQVTGLDDFNDFYAPSLKRRNVAAHLGHPRYKLVVADIRDPGELAGALRGSFDVIVHLAARAGVRPSIADPVLYQDTNVGGTQNLLEFARVRRVPHIVFASSSSVYGVNPRVPWSESDAVLLPISPYASTKISGELLGHVYTHLFGLRFIALRFFTVYGPRQRPDLAIRKFTEAILAGERIALFGSGDSRRDYTYIDDIVSGICAAMDYDATAYEVINLGNSQAVSLTALIEAIEWATGRRARIQRAPDQPGDVPQTWADITKAQQLLGYAPSTPMRAGIERTVAWIESERREHPVAPPGLPWLPSDVSRDRRPMGV